MEPTIVGQPAEQQQQGEDSEPYTARRAESLDATGVQLLLKRQTEAVFGRVNVDNVIERANLAITLAGKDDEVLAFGALFDYPTSTSGVNSTCWEEWLHSKFECKLANPMNSLFLGLFVAKDGFKEGALAEILRMTFVAVPLVHYVFLPVAATVPVGPVIESHFSPVPVYDDSSVSYILWAAHHHQHFSVLHVRSAKQEDNDDLMPIFQQLPGDMTSQYGEYFIAELVEAEDETHKTLVVEVGGRAVGLISLSSELDLPLLQQCYQLEPYHGLCKPSDQDEITMVPDDSSESVSNKDVNHHSQPSTHSYSSIKSELADSVESEKQAPAPGSPLQQGGVLAADSITSEQATSLGSDSTQQQQEQPAVVPPDKETTEEPKATAAEAAPDEGLPSPGTPPPAPSSPEAPPPPQPAPVAERPHIVYHGPSNAVAVRLFCIDDQYEMRSVDFLPTVFQLFPEYDFLVLTQPHASPEFPLLSHFTRVPPQLRSTLPQELYVLHRCSLLHSLKVVPMSDSHYNGVLTLSATLNSSDDLLTDVKHYLQAGRDPLDQGATRMRVFVAECLEQVVGAIVLRQEEDIRYLRSHYNMEDFVFYSQHRPHEHQHVHHLLLNPVFTPHTKHFLKEAMRQSESTCLYYPLYPPTTNTSGATVITKPHSHIAALTEMVPIQARRQVVYPAGLGLNSPAPELLETKPPFSLYHTSRKLSLEPKACVNARIVVVGGSDTALSLLETLVFSPHLRFNNLMLVSPHGLPSTSTLSSSHMPISCRFGPEALLGLSAWVGVAKGWLTTINREEQWVGVVSDSGTENMLPYDYLVLCTGAQFVKEPSDGADSEIPRQVFSLDSREQALQLMDWVTHQLVPVDNGRLVVYGSTLTAYSCLHYLLDVVGLAGERITLVLPPSDPSCFNNPTVEKQVQQALSTTGVEVLDGYRVVCYNPGGESNGSDLHSVQLASSSDTITVNCRAMICAASKHVNEIAFQAINDACLVFDYRLVINTAHSTNDPRVLAAGPLTKYSRVYYADQWNHDRFCPREVGQKLASTLLNILDPTQPLSTTNTTSDDDDDTSNDLLPVYTRPAIISASLPGGLHYLHIEKPNLGERLVDLMKKPDYGKEMITQSSNGYFRLHLNQYNRVQTITVLSLEPFEESNYVCLYNIHEKYLNSLVSRYDEGLIRDFFQYFREEWASAVFHDRFPDFLREIQDILSTPNDDQQISVLAKVQQMIEDGHSLSVDSYQPQLAAEFAQSPLRTVLIRRLHRYLHYNSYHLPMFSHPDMT